MKKILTGMATALIVATMLMGCKKTIEITGVTISSPEETINVGSTVTLSYTVEPQGAEVESAEWISSDGGVASVDQNGVVTGVAAGNATITIKINGQFTSDCAVTVNPVFTVAAGKTVKFSPANLWWDGSNWQFETNQTDYQTSWDANHVSHFYWTKTAEASYTKDYDDGTCAETDQFFADGSDDSHKLTVSGQSGWYVLSKDQWTYLIETREGNRFAKAMVNSVKGLIIFPDGYTDTTSGEGIADVNSASAAFPSTSISTATWSSMENSGCVFLPVAGDRYGSNFGSAGTFADYRSSTPHSSNANNAYILSISNSNVRPAANFGRNYGLSLRLARDIE